MKDKILNVLDCLNGIDGLKFDGERYSLPNKHKETLEKFQLPFEEYGESVQLKIKAYFSPAIVKYAPILNSEILCTDVAHDFIVCDLPGDLVQYYSANSSYEVYGRKDINLLKKIKSIVAYFNFFNYLKSDDFCDYFNAANNEIVLYNSTNGIQKITFETIPNIDFQVNTEVATIALMDYAKPLEFKFFFQNAAFVLSGKTGITSITDIIRDYIKVISITKRDYQLVSKKFNFDTFQDSLVKEKNKYFGNIRDIINKVAGQAVGIPVSIGATVFTSYKISDDLPLLILLLITFLIYITFYLTIQSFYKNDVNELRRDFNRDFEVIKVRSGLPSETINVEMRAIENKLSKTDSIIKWLKVTIVGLGIIVSFFMVSQMVSQPN